MGMNGADKKGPVLSGNKARKSPTGKVGKAARMIVVQKDKIEETLASCQMTITELATTLDLSNDTIRNRINEMVIDGRPIRVAGWHVLDTTMVRIWGYGYERDEPKPVRVRVAAIRKRRRADGAHVCTPAAQTVRYRREGMDEWLFRIRELR